jgi:hypothetical protein
VALASSGDDAARLSSAVRAAAEARAREALRRQAVGALSSFPLGADVSSFPLGAVDVPSHPVEGLSLESPLSMQLPERPMHDSGEGSAGGDGGGRGGSGVAAVEGGP